MARTILDTNVHCPDCAKKIRSAVINLYGVQKVRVTPETRLVVITGTVDAEVLRSRIERKLGRTVAIISHGAAPEPVDGHWAAPPPRYGPHYVGWGMPPAQPRRRYGDAPQQAYPYAENLWAAPLPPPRRRHVSHGVPARRDDEEGPENCCSIQ